MTTSVLPMLAWPLFAGTGVQAGVTTRDGGVSTGPYATLNLSSRVGDDPAAVDENRSRVAATFGGELVIAEQVHGAEVAVVTDAGRSPVPGVDALVTTTPGLALAVFAADCVPLVLADPVARVVAVVHAGWRGTVAGVTSAALSTMASLGAVPERILAGIGPAIAPDRYQVGVEVADAAAAAGLGDALRPDGTGRFQFDLVGANRRLLSDAGVRMIAAAEAVTGQEFYSHRAGAPTGRFATVARLVP